MANTVNIITIELNNVTYTQTRPNYYYKKQDGKQVRISKAEWEQAFEEYTQQAQDTADTDTEWMQEYGPELEEAWAEVDEQWDAEKEIEERKEIQAKADKVAEDAMNGMVIPKSALEANKKYIKKQSKSRKSKDVALEVDGVTLTAKQVDFLREMSKTSFYENSTESALWCDTLVDEIGGQFAEKPMTVGAIISTLKEKNLITTGVERVNGKKARFFTFTDLGKVVLTELGLN